MLFTDEAPYPRLYRYPLSRLDGGTHAPERPIGAGLDYVVDSADARPRLHATKSLTSVWSVAYRHERELLARGWQATPYPPASHAKSD